ncbi:MAG: 2'-5' RNA ligase family protein [Turicibacter sp.]
MEEKFLGLVALFDDETNEKFQEIKQLLNEMGLVTSSIPPHITLGCYVEVDENELSDYIELVCRKIKPFEVNFNHIGLFGLNVLFVAPHVSKDLMKIHQEIHEKYDEHCGEIGYNYSVKSNNWVPHTTIFSSEPQQVMQALPVVSEKFKPFVGTIVGLSLCEFYPMREIQYFLLG